MTEVKINYTHDGKEFSLHFPYADVRANVTTEGWDSSLTYSVTVEGPNPEIGVVEPETEMERIRRELKEEIAEAILNSDDVNPFTTDDDAYQINAEAVLSLFEAKGFPLERLDLMTAETTDLHEERDKLRQQVEDLIAEVRSLEAEIAANEVPDLKLDGVQPMWPPQMPCPYPLVTWNSDSTNSRPRALPDPIWV